MGLFEIVVDSTCDMELEEYQRLGVRMIPFHVSPNGKDYYRDWTEMNPREFVMTLLNNPDFVPKTSTPAPEEYMSVFEEAYVNGKGVICLCATQTLTSVIRTAEAAKRNFLEKRPDAEIEVMDSQLMTAGLACFVAEAVKLRDSGLPLSEAFKLLLASRDESVVYFMNGGTKYLRLGGRIGKVAGAATEILNIKPLIIMKGGEIQPFGVVRSRGKGASKLVAAAKEYIAQKGLKIHEIAIWIGASHDVWQELPSLKELLEKELGVILGKERITVGAAVVAHAGPGILGFGLIKRV